MCKCAFCQRKISDILSACHPSGVDKWVVGLFIRCVSGGAIWWMPTGLQALCSWLQPLSAACGSFLPVLNTVVIPGLLPVFVVLSCVAACMYVLSYVTACDCHAGLKRQLWVWLWLLLLLSAAGCLKNWRMMNRWSECISHKCTNT